MSPARLALPLLVITVDGVAKSGSVCTSTLFAGGAPAVLVSDRNQLHRPQVPVGLG